MVASVSKPLASKFFLEIRILQRKLRRLLDLGDDRFRRLGRREQPEEQAAPPGRG